MLRDSVVPKPPLLRAYGAGGLQLGLSAPSSSPLLHPTREAKKIKRGGLWAGCLFERQSWGTPTGTRVLSPELRAGGASPRKANHGRQTEEKGRPSPCPRSPPWLEDCNIVCLAQTCSLPPAFKNTDKDGSTLSSAAMGAYSSDHRFKSYYCSCKV